jgi:DNA-binding SARP family transcriptional activator
MRAYSLGHQKSLALKQYERYRKTIQAELNSNPEPEIQALYECIKNGEMFSDPSMAACGIR